MLKTSNFQSIWQPHWTDQMPAIPLSHQSSHTLNKLISNLSIVISLRCLIVVNHCLRKTVASIFQIYWIDILRIVQSRRQRLAKFCVQNTSTSVSLWSSMDSLISTKLNRSVLMAALKFPNDSDGTKYLVCALKLNYYLFPKYLCICCEMYR